MTQKEEAPTQDTQDMGFEAEKAERAETTTSYTGGDTTGGETGRDTTGGESQRGERGAVSVVLQAAMEDSNAAQLFAPSSSGARYVYLCVYMCIYVCVLI